MCQIREVLPVTGLKGQGEKLSLEPGRNGETEKVT